MNKEVLKRLIKETILENRKNSVLLESPYLREAEVDLSLDDVLGMLRDTKAKAKLQRFGILTAENPRGEAADKSSNAKRMSVLRSALDKAGLDYVKLDGKYGGEETSYFVLNMSKHDLIYLGKKFKQAAVIGGEKLIRNYRENQPSVYFAMTYYQTEPDGSEEPAYDPQEYYAVDNREVVVAGPEADAKTDYFSEIGGKKFVIPFFSDAEGHEMGDEPSPFPADKSYQV
jgi:hypothetical protein